MPANTALHLNVRSTLRARGPDGGVERGFRTASNNGSLLRAEMCPQTPLALSATDSRQRRFGHTECDGPSTCDYRKGGTQSHSASHTPASWQST